MKKMIAVIVLLIGLASAQNWTQYGFQAEPGVSVGTPFMLNLMARFWYGGFGISGCGLWLPTGFNYLNGYGAEGDVMYRLIIPGVSVQPFVALGYGNSSVSSTVSGITPITFSASYVGLQVGAYYLGAFAQLGFGVGLPPGYFTITGGGNSTKLPVFPLLQIGYTGTIGGTSSGGSTGGGSSGGGGGGTKGAHSK